MPKEKELTRCPKCGEEFADFVAGGYGLYGLQNYDKIGLRCTNKKCSQEYYWYPKTGKLTPRK